MMSFPSGRSPLIPKFQKYKKAGPRTELQVESSGLMIHGHSNQFQNRLMQDKAQA
jgi:hypothetical protein